MIYFLLSKTRLSDSVCCKKFVCGLKAGWEYFDSTSQGLLDLENHMRDTDKAADLPIRVIDGREDVMAGIEEAMSLEDFFWTLRNELDS